MKYSGCFPAQGGIDMREQYVLMESGIIDTDTNTIVQDPVIENLVRRLNQLYLEGKDTEFENLLNDDEVCINLTNEQMAILSNTRLNDNSPHTVWSKASEIEYDRFAWPLNE